MNCADVGDDLVREIVARVEHGQHDAVDRQVRIERRPHLLDGLQQLRQAFEREELALQRHQDRVRRRHRVDGEQVERRRAVDQHVGVVAVRRRRWCSAPRSRRAAGTRGRASCRARARGRRDPWSRARCAAAAPRSRPPRRAAAPRRSARRRSRQLRLRRSMPRPVEALPCGSRSTISTRSPIAASAVPRLIAVVVLPTPPFWLASARMRGWPARHAAAYPLDKLHQLRSCAAAIRCLADSDAPLDPVEFDDPAVLRRCGWNEVCG